MGLYSSWHCEKVTKKKKQFITLCAAASRGPSPGLLAANEEACNFQGFSGKIGVFKRAIEDGWFTALECRCVCVCLEPGLERNMMSTCDSGDASHRIIDV